MAASVRSAKRKATPIVLAVLHPKGGVGRSTTVWQLGAELALPGKRVCFEDMDQGAHRSPTFGEYPLGLARLPPRVAATTNGVRLVLLRTASDAQRDGR